MRFIRLFIGETVDQCNDCNDITESYANYAITFKESIFQELPDSSPKGVMLFTENIAKYYGFDAEIHTCKLPCLVTRYSVIDAGNGRCPQVSSAWSFRNCLFVERAESPHSDEYSPQSLFLMSHTLAEFTPVVYKDDCGNCGFINDTRFRIVATCEVSFLLLAYDSVDDALSVWRIRDCVREVGVVCVLRDRCYSLTGLRQSI